MKFALSFAALLLGAGATPLANNDMVLDAILAEAAVVPRKVEHVVRVVDVQLAPQDQVCVINIARPGVIQTVTVNGVWDWTSFCGTFLPQAQPTTVLTTIWATTKVTATLPTKTSTTQKLALTTVVAVDPATAKTVYCPIPSTGATCTQSGWGYANNNLHAGAEDPVACHELCLKTPACQSFQISNETDPAIIPQCNLYNVTSGGSTNYVIGAAPFLLYDRGCPNNLPAGCGQPHPSYNTITAGPPEPTVAPPSSPFSIGGPPGGREHGFVERDAEASPEKELVDRKELEEQATLPPPPWVLLTLLGTATLSDLCSCVMPPATRATTMTLLGPTYVTTTIQPLIIKTITTISTVTAIGDGTIWVSVA